ncbi:MAG: HNH endonuclease [Verrucomicrobiae bacterium]|nr:HNH endonuclease [Verrucomicrobiae bacterium]
MQSALSECVLVLNRLWQAVNVCSAKRAFCLLYENHAHVVHSTDGDFSTLDFAAWCDHSEHLDEDVPAIQTVSIRLIVPKVIILLFYDRLPRKEIKLTRQNIFERDRHQCQYCGRTLSKQELNIDHVHPRHRGGSATWENLVCSCIECNSRKANHMPHEVGMRLLRSPNRPKWRPFLAIPRTRLNDSLCRHFLDPSLWEVEFGEESVS